MVEGLILDGCHGFVTGLCRRYCYPLTPRKRASISERYKYGNEGMIGRRHVFHIGGYDPIVPEKQLERFRRSLSSFKRTWNVSSQTSAIADILESQRFLGVGGLGAELEDCRLLSKCSRWDDLVLRDSQRGMLSRLYHSGATLFDFARNGTLISVCRRKLEIRRFFYFSVFLRRAVWACRRRIGLCCNPAVEFDGLAAAIFGIFVAVMIFLALMHWLGPRRRINHALDDAIFSRQFLHGQRPEMERRIDDFARRILERVRKADVDEILVVGHSLGAAMAIAAVARGLKQDPQFAKHGPTIVRSDGRCHDPEILFASERRSVSTGDASCCRRNVHSLGGIPGA